MGSFKFFLPLYLAVLAFFIVQLFLGPSGILAVYELEEYKGRLQDHINYLSDRGEMLQEQLSSLESGDQWKAIPAMEAGFVQESWLSIRFDQDIKPPVRVRYNPGTLMAEEANKVRSDSYAGLRAGLVAALLIALGTLVIGALVQSLIRSQRASRV